MTTAILRPNGTVLAAGSVTGAASEHAALSDDSDGSYVTGDQGEYDLGTVSMGSGAIIKTVAVRFRGRGDSAAVGFALEAQSAGSMVAALGGTATTTIATYTGSASPVSLTQTQVDALTVEFQAEGSDLRLMEAYVDLVYVTQPSTTVTAVTPDPYTASTTVPIAWTNTLDTDGGAQTRYEIKVFTDAQYLAGGFDPATSTPYYTTGQVISSALTANVGPLANSDTYRAYVRVAQTVNGASHWSAWAFDEFTMNVATSDVSTVVGSPGASESSILVTVTRDGASLAWEFVEVQRSIDAGTTWTDVRGATYVDSTGHATTFTVTDYETPNGQATLYRARATYLSSGLPITSSWTTSASTAWASDDVWLKDPLDPAKNLTVTFRTPIDQSNGNRRGVFQVLGRKNPIVITDGFRSPVSEFAFRTMTLDDLDELLAILNTGNVLLLQTPPGRSWVSRYISIGRFVEQPAGRNLVLPVSFVFCSDVVEVNAPADPDAGR